MKKYESIQYLRALAALLVVFHHARNPAPGFFNPLETFGFGQAGVDVFFVISGFIMYAAAKDEPPVEFLRRRLIRIAPLYWIATLLLAVSFLKNAVVALDPPFVAELAQSMLFVPHYSLLNPAEIWPFLTPGWTLNYEMFFYVVFALGIAARRLIPFVTVALLGLVALGALVRSDSALWLTYTNPLLLEFLAGIFIARHAARLTSPMLPILLPLGLMGLVAGEFTGGPRFIVWGVPAAMMVIGAIALEGQGRLRRIPVAGLLGDASYSIYLFHGFATGKLGKIRDALPLTGWPQFLAVVAAGLLASTLLGLVAYFLVEKPLLRILLPRKQRPVAAA